MITHVLIIDSDSSAAQTTRALVEHLLAEATVAVELSVEFGRLHMQQHATDALIIDPSPYDLAAVRLLAWLKTERPTTCVIVFASGATPALRQQMAELAVDLYLEKYQAPALLVQKLREALARLRNDLRM